MDIYDGVIGPMPIMIILFGLIVFANIAIAKDRRDQDKKLKETRVKLNRF